MPLISGQSPDGDKICIERKTFKQLLGLLCHSTDILANLRHREVFLESLDTYLADLTEFDDSDCFRASLLLDAYYEYATASLVQLANELDEALNLIRAVKHD